MKLILVLFLSGVAYATSSPSCSEHKLDKCSYGDPMTHDDAFKETEEYLNGVCKSMGCMKDFKRRCGVDGIESGMKAMVNQAEKIYNAVCDEHSEPMRQKYFQSVRCVNKQLQKDFPTCNINRDIERDDPNFCPTMAKSVNCARDVIRKECGETAREVFVAIYPGLDFYDCEE